MINKEISYWAPLFSLLPALFSFLCHLSKYNRHFFLYTKLVAGTAFLTSGIFPSHPRTAVSPIFSIEQPLRLCYAQCVLTIVPRTRAM